MIMRLVSSQRTAARQCVPAVTRAFAPQLAAQGSSAVLNVLSALSWLSFPGSGAYRAAKSAEWSLANALRQELAAQGTRMTALHVGYMDTDMTGRPDVPKAGLSGGVPALHPQFA